MAKCKSCKINITEGTEYCKDCQDKIGANTNESYLDSLLNSVKISPSVENVYKKKKIANENSNSPDKVINQVNRNGLEEASKPRQRKAPVHTPETDEDDLYRVDFSDIEDFNRYDFEEDLGDIDSDITINDEDLFGENLSDLLKEEDNMEEELDVQTEADKLLELEGADVQQAAGYIEDGEAITDSNIEEISQPFYDEASVPLDSDEFQDEYSGLSEDTDIDLDLDELMNNLDTQNLEAKVETNMANPDEDMFSTFGNDDIVELLSSDGSNDSKKNDLEQMEDGHDDFLSLLSQVSDEDEAAEDIRAISDMLSGNLNSYMDSNMPSNVGEVFSDALTAVSSLNDYDLSEASISGDIPDKELKKSKKGKKEKIKEEKKTKEKAAENGPKQSLFQQLFGNIKDDMTAAKFEEEQNKLTDPKAEKRKKAKGKDKNNAIASGKEDEDSVVQKGGKGRATKKASKKEQAERKKKTKEVIEVIDEIDEDPGRVNRVGAIIVFFFFGIIAIILIIGTNMITYTLSIQHATSYFNHRRYNQAYNEVYGVDIKDEDIGLYDKIQTVMFVNKQLNSYNNYYALERYPEALDSLLKGLSRYEKYIELATLLGIESDLDYVKSQILAELNNVFELTEEDAMQILSYDSKDDYSLAVYDVVLERLNN